MAERLIGAPACRQKEHEMITYLRKNPPHVAFDPDTIIILSSALDEAFASANATFKLDGQSEAARMALAKHIVDMAAGGERNPQSLVGLAPIWWTVECLGSGYRV